MQKYTKLEKIDITYENGLSLIGILQRLQMDGVDLQTVTVEADNEQARYSDYEMAVASLQYTVPMTDAEIEKRRAYDRATEAAHRERDLQLLENLKKKNDRTN